MLSKIVEHSFYLGVLAASIMGSWHCAGMCGPFGGLFAKTNLKSQLAYHIGRLFTYSLLVIILHKLGSGFKWNGIAWIFPIIVLFWILTISQSFFKSRRSFLPRSFFNWFYRLIAISTKHAQKLPSGLKEFSLGMVTTLLPCTWLYGFLFLGASRESPIKAVAVIFLFWLGTIPALVLTHNALFKFSSSLKVKSKRWGTALALGLSALTLFTHFHLFEVLLSPKEATSPHASCPLHPKN